MYIKRLKSYPSKTKLAIIGSPLVTLEPDGSIGGSLIDSYEEAQNKLENLHQAIKEYDEARTAYEYNVMAVDTIWRKSNKEYAKYAGVGEARYEKEQEVIYSRMDTMLVDMNLEFTPKSEVYARIVGENSIISPSKFGRMMTEYGYTSCSKRIDDKLIKIWRRG